jgi:hypothetical protein
MLNTGGGRRMFHRFDYFNASYSPFGKNDVRACVSVFANAILHVAIWSRVMSALWVFSFLQLTLPRFVRAQLRTIFLKYENPSEGAYFAELVNEVYAKNDALGHNVLLGADCQRCHM